MSGPEIFSVPVKTWLAPDVYRKLHRLSLERGTTVGVLVAVAASQATSRRQPVPQKYARMTPERFQYLCQLAKTDLTMKQIANELGCSLSTVYNHMQRARSQS